MVPAHWLYYAYQLFKKLLKLFTISPVCLATITLMCSSTPQPLLRSHTLNQSTNVSLNRAVLELIVQFSSTCFHPLIHIDNLLLSQVLPLHFEMPFLSVLPVVSVGLQKLCYSLCLRWPDNDIKVVVQIRKCGLHCHVLSNNFKITFF